MSFIRNLRDRFAIGSKQRRRPHRKISNIGRRKGRIIQRHLSTYQCSCDHGNALSREIKL